MSFSEQLKKARLRKRMTQQEVADAMCVTNSTYCGYETGKRKPDVEKLKQLARILETSVDLLLEMDSADNAGEYAFRKSAGESPRGEEGQTPVSGKAKIMILGSQGKEAIFISQEVNEEDAEMIRRVIRSANQDKKKNKSI